MKKKRKEKGLKSNNERSKVALQESLYEQHSTYFAIYGQIYHISFDRFFFLIEILGKHRQKKKPWVTAEILDLRDNRRELRKKRF